MYRLGVCLGVLFSTFLSPATIFAVTIVPNPSMVCLGACPTSAVTGAPTSAIIPTSMPGNTGGNPAPTTAQNPNPSVPCSQTTINTANATNEANAHKGSFNANQGLLQQILQLLKKLMQFIQQLGGGGGGGDNTPVPANLQPTVAQTNPAPIAGGNPAPTQAPCPPTQPPPGQTNPVTSQQPASPPAMSQNPSTTPPATATGTRDPFKQPFSSQSFWNLGIGSGAQWSNDTDADTIALHTTGGAINAEEWSQPVFIGKASDPVATFTCNDDLFPVTPKQVHTPSNAQPAEPAADGDHHIGGFDETQPTKMFSYFGCTKNGNSFSCALCRVDDVCSDQLTGGEGLADYNFIIGTIRTWELQAGEIKHMLRYAADPNHTKSPGTSWDQNIPWPMTHEDYQGPSIYKGGLVAGSTIGIPSTVNLDSLGLSKGGMMLAKALQQYGAVWRDMSGNPGITLYAEPEAEGMPELDEMRNDLNTKIISQLKVLRNQSLTSVNGGGTPLPPPLPPIDPKICP